MSPKLGPAPQILPTHGSKGRKGSRSSLTSGKADTLRVRGGGLLVTRPQGRQPAVGMSQATISGLF